MHGGARLPDPWSPLRRSRETAFKLRSPAFAPSGEIPLKHTRDGAEASPPRRWTDPPEGTRGYALTLDDLDSTAGIGSHWVLYGIPANRRELPEGIRPQDTVSGIGNQGVNDLEVVGYPGPCPPPGPAHRYVFRLYALDAPLPLPPRRTRRDLLKAMQGRILIRVDLIARYQRKGTPEAIDVRR